MSIRPIDMQVTIQKSDHYTKEFNYDNKTNNTQQGISVETQKQVDQDQRQIVSADETKNNRIDRDSSNRSQTKDNYSKGGGNNKKESHDGEITLTEDDKGVFIDIII